MTDNISKFNSQRAWEILSFLAAQDKRVPGTDGHTQAITWLYDTLKMNVDFAWLQKFNIVLRSKRIECSNICGFIKGTSNSKRTLLIGSHFDTRLIADNEADLELRSQPIPGVNDGTSGIVIILELARIFNTYKPVDNIVFVLFDAEDIGNIDGNEFGIGAQYYAQHGRIRPDCAIILDMVAGKNMRLNIDQNSLLTQESNVILNDLFMIGRELRYSCFFQNRISAIIGDHTPFLNERIPSIILIDIDYPQWHTHSDDLSACSKDSLYYIGDVLYRYCLQKQVV